jgi:hypothetical protein
MSPSSDRSNIPCQSFPALRVLPAPGVTGAGRLRLTPSRAFVTLPPATVLPCLPRFLGCHLECGAGPMRDLVLLRKPLKRDGAS